MDIVVFAWIGGVLDSLVASIMFPAVRAVMDIARPIANWGLMIYVIFIAIALSGRSGNQSAGSLLWTFVKVVVVTQFSLNFNVYQEYVINVINAFYTVVSTAVSGREDATTIYSVLDGLIGKGADTTGEAFRKMKDVGIFAIDLRILWAVAGFAIMVGTVLVTLGGGAVIMGAFILIMILTSIGPLFIMASLFPLTSKFTVSWVSTVLTQALNIIIASVVMVFAVAIFGGMLTDINTSQAAGRAAPLAVIFLTAITVGLLYYVVRNIGSLSAGLSGGLSTAALTVRDIAESYRAPERVINPQSTRRDMATNLPVNDSRVGHIISGNSPVNPNYVKRGYNNAARHYGFRNKGSMKGR